MKAGVTLRAPAKINLTLEVLAKQENGLHALRSVMVPLDLFDEIEIEPSDRFEFRCDRAGLQDNNLVERALRALIPEPKFSIALRKRIPTAAGLGGGSSDAAAILLAAQHGFFGKSGDVDYLRIAKALGSDVPFFLTETAALVEATGERVTALGAPPPWHAVIIKPPVAVSTAEAYTALDGRERPGRTRNSSASLALGEALQRSQFERVIELMQNDFEDVILSQNEPVKIAIDALLKAGAKGAMLSGSGSAVFALAQNLSERERMQRRLTVPAEFEIFGCAFWSGEAWKAA